MPRLARTPFPPNPPENATSSSEVLATACFLSIKERDQCILGRCFWSAGVVPAACLPAPGSLFLTCSFPFSRGIYKEGGVVSTGLGRGAARVSGG